MLTIVLLLALGAFALTLIHAAGKAPLWPAVLLLTVAELLRSIPVGR